MADTYLQYQSTKQSYTRTDSLVDILESINKNPTAYTTVQKPIVNNIGEQFNNQSNNSQKGEAMDREQYNIRADNNCR